MLVFLAHGALTYAQSTPTDVHLKLALADNKTTFRIGEPITVVMEFSADVDGYQVDTLPDQKQPTSDTVSISPDLGVNHWLDEKNDGLRYGRDVSSSVNVSRSPTPVKLVLNDTLRFDRPGHYKVSINTRRVSSRATRAPLVLTTNEVEFEIVAMSDDDEKREVARLSTLLDAKRDLATEENVTKELSYLTGNISTREKVRRFLNPENRGGNYQAHIFYGLYIARNRDLVLRLLETALRDPGQPVNSSLLSVVSSIRFLLQNNGRAGEPRVVYELSPDGDPRLREIQNGYLNELALGLNKRSGKSLTTTAMTILTMSRKDGENTTALTREARRVLVQQFDSLHPFDQEYLLRMKWDDLRDDSLISSMKKMLSYKGVATKNLHDAALNRLLEIAPEEARPYVIAEIRDPTSLVDLEILGKLSDKSLPEVDGPLLEQIGRLAASTRNFDRVYLKQKASLAVRYATENIFPEVMEIYREKAAKLPLDSRAQLLAYLAKHNERETIPLIEEVLAEMQPSEDFNFLPELTQLYYSDGIAAVLKKRLETDEPHAASNAAYLIGKYGNSSDEAVLRARLERWRIEWRDRADEANANQQFMVERELIYALLHGKSWKLTPERVKELQQSCLTKHCRQSINVP